LYKQQTIASAAWWYVEGFAERSGMQVTFDSPSGLERMPDSVEIALFRVLQESLTNVHRHSGSKKTEIRVLVHVADKHVTMVVRDFGSGLPAGMLERFRTSHSGVGVGLVGMRKRIRELGGQLDIQSDAATGTILDRIGPNLTFCERRRAPRNPAVRRIPRPRPLAISLKVVRTEARTELRREFGNRSNCRRYKPLERLPM
jgi:signal transduction histidine kinase